MTTMNISLPDEMRAFIEAQVTQEGYASASEYFAPWSVTAEKRQAKRELEVKLREALLSGPAEPMTREDWESIGRGALERIASEQPHQ